MNNGNNGTALAVAAPRETDLLHFSNEQVDVIRKQIAPTGTPAELEMFLTLCTRRGLDPFAKQIYFIKYGTNNPAAFVVSIDALRLIADRTKCYAPGRAATYTYQPDGTLESATAYVMKLAAGAWLEVSETAFYDEYVQKSNGRPRDKWASMPRVMLSKCAEARALRRAFPEDLTALYEESEIETQPSAPLPPTTPPLGRNKLGRTEMVGAAPTPAPEAAAPAAEVVEGEVVPPPTLQTARGIIGGVEQKLSKTGKTYWRVKIGGVWFSTWHKTIGADAPRLDGCEVDYTYTDNGEFKNLETLTGVVQREPGEDEDEAAYVDAFEQGGQ